MSNKTIYPNLTAPYKLCNHVLKNRIVAMPSNGHCINGTEPFPRERFIQTYVEKAKVAGLVTCHGWGNTPMKDKDELLWDFDSVGSCKEITRLTERIHFHGALAETFLVPDWNETYDVGNYIPPTPPFFLPERPMLPKEEIYKMVDAYVEQAVKSKRVGFDGVFIHASYRVFPIARFLSPLTNNRQDEFGGSLENRARFLLMVCKAIKEACGQDFIIHIGMSGEDHEDGGMTIEDTIEIVKMGEGYFDIIQLRCWDINWAHPVGYMEKLPFQYMTKALKDAGCKVSVLGVAGYLDPQDAEEALVNGIADLIGVGRAWVSNPDYEKVIYEGDHDALIPCIRCNRCVNLEKDVPFRDVCSVNPIWGWELEQKIHEEPAERIKRVAVIGGGPAGMEAAITAAKRGHKVTIYEKTDKLGGQLNLAEVPGFKWPIRDYKKYLIKQCEKLGVTICFNTMVDREFLLNKNFDEVIIAIGSNPIMPAISGIDLGNVMSVRAVYGHEEELPKNILIVGGGEIGVETGVHLAECGCKVTLIEQGSELAPDAPFMHFRSVFMDYVERTENFTYLLNATCKQITETGLIYEDANGKEIPLDGNKVIIAVGSVAKQDEAISLCMPGKRVHIVGDCKKASTIQHATRTGYAAAIRL